MANSVTNINVSYVPGSSTDVYATWNWYDANTQYRIDTTKGFKVVWYYFDLNQNGFIGNEHEITVDKTHYSDYLNDSYSVPANSTFVQVRIKPIAESYSTGQGSAEYWQGDWAQSAWFPVSGTSVLGIPNAPSLSLDERKLTLTVSDVSGEAPSGLKKQIEFRLFKDHVVFNTTQIISNISTDGYASAVYTIDDGSKYTAQCRYIWGKYLGEWSSVSQELSSLPSIPSSITVCKTVPGPNEDEPRVRLEWTPVSSAETYDIQISTDETLLEFNQEATITGIETPYYTISNNLTMGVVNYFRVRAVNDGGTSKWSNASALPVGTQAMAPTIWSSKTLVTDGSTVDLFWTHNSADGSDMQGARLWIDSTDAEEPVEYLIHRSIDPSTGDPVLEWYGTAPSNMTLSVTKNINCCTVDCSVYETGTVITWKMATRGVLEQTEYEYSAPREFIIYPEPTLSLSFNYSSTDATSTLSKLQRFPAFAHFIPGPIILLNSSDVVYPVEHYPITFRLEIIAYGTYTTTDNAGREYVVNALDSVYDEVFDIPKDLAGESQFDFRIDAGDVNLQNGVTYRLRGSVTMNSGVTVSNDSILFTVEWANLVYDADAEIGYNEDTYSMFIKPYSMTNGSYSIGTVMSVYRKEYDGRLIEIARNIPNDGISFVTDPHPSLNYARYRIVATSMLNGTMVYYDTPPYRVDEKAIIIQWDEKWSNYLDEGLNVMKDPSWTGSILRLPYNIDITNNYNRDVKNVEYVGREHPVSYHGTQIGETSTWSTDIPKNDIETIYALRRLSAWKGNVYVREPSGTGYWAVVNVTFSLKHLDVITPVQIEITRVDGGV